MKAGQIPFQIIPLGGTHPDEFHPGMLISALNQCGVFLCTRGVVEVSLDEVSYSIRQGDIYIYTPSSLVHLLRRSADAEGFLVKAEVDYIFPIVQRAAPVEDLLFLRGHPCISLGEEHSRSVLRQLENLHAHTLEWHATEGQRRHLYLEWIKAMGQCICLELMNIYFTQRPAQPKKHSRKDIIFHDFQLALFRHFRTERDVAFYARLQNLAPRYFSSIIKEKSGYNALQWIAQQVITEAKLLLETSEMSVKEISNRLNFPSQSFFGKYFKQYTGVSPKEYREGLLRCVR